MVFTGLVAMLVAFSETHLPVSLLQLLVGGIALILGSASANVLTNYRDRDIITNANLLRLITELG